MNPLDLRWQMVRDRWPTRVKNATSPAVVIPPYSVVLISTSTSTNDEIVHSVIKPNAASTDFNWSNYLVTGPFAIGVGTSDEGLATTLVQPHYVRYDTGTPSKNEIWGPKHGQFTLSKAYYGFEIIGGNTTASGNNVTIARWVGVGEVLIKNETGSSIAGGTSGGPTNVNVYSGTAGSETDTGMDLTVYNRSSTSWATGKFGMAAHVNNAVYGVPYQT